MQQTSGLILLQRRFLSCLVLLCTTFLLFPAPGHSAQARKIKTKTVTHQDLQPRLFLALASPPKYLVIEPVPIPDEGAATPEEKGISPFFGSDEVSIYQLTPERPAIASNDEVALERPEFKAGVKVNMGTVKFNLGYTLPASQVETIVRPLGVNLGAGDDIKRITLGVEIPF